MVKDVMVFQQWVRVVEAVGYEMRIKYYEYFNVIFSNNKERVLLIE